MKRYSYSLYLALVVIIFLAVATTTTINSIVSYYNIKNKTITYMKSSSAQALLSIKDNVQNLIEAYAVHEYETIIFNEMSRKSIGAIIIEDYNMATIVGKDSYITGKIKIEGKIKEFEVDNLIQKKYLSHFFYKLESQLLNKEKKKIGKISIYLSDEVLQKELDDIISTNLKITIFLSLFLIIFLFIIIRKIILKPLSNIVETISHRDSDGIPKKPIQSYALIEIDELVRNINKMISSIRHSSNTLKKEQNRLKYLLEMSPIAVRIAKNKGEDVVFANKAYAKLLKIDEADSFHANPKDNYKNKMEYEQLVKSLKKSKPIYNKLIELTIKGETAWVLASYMTIDFDKEESIIGWFYDVTKEKQSENKLFEALQLQTTIFDNSGYVILRTDINGIIKQINKEGEILLGYKAEELIDKYTPSKFHLEEELHKKKLVLEYELKKEVKNLFDLFIIKPKNRLQSDEEWTYVSKDGHHIPISLSVSILRNKDGEIFGYIGIAKDITQNKILESQSKLASMGEMIGNIAHQWRQPLSAISSVASATRIKSEFDIVQKDELSEDMDSILDQVNYLSKTIDDFREFIKDKHSQEKFLLSSAINKALSILKSTITNHNLTIILNNKEDEEIIGYENQLIQAFINIINNAKDAMKEKISDKDKRLLFIDFRKEENRFMIDIKDNAGGIKTDIIDKIFEPYFTTKHQSIGTGIGLSMTYQIITEYHNATIQAFNIDFQYEGENYTGANFEIAFEIE